jgi:hypothetical protein
MLRRYGFERTRRQVSGKGFMGWFDAMFLRL